MLLNASPKQLGYSIKLNLSPSVWHCWKVVTKLFYPTLQWYIPGNESPVLLDFSQNQQETKALAHFKNSSCIKMQAYPNLYRPAKNINIFDKQARLQRPQSSSPGQKTWWLLFSNMFLLENILIQNNLTFWWMLGVLTWIRWLMNSIDIFWGNPSWLYYFERWVVLSRFPRQV